MMDSGVRDDMSLDRYQEYGTGVKENELELEHDVEGKQKGIRNAHIVGRGSYEQFDRVKINYICIEFSMQLRVGS